MTVGTLTSVLSELEHRRRELGMPVTALAKRSGVSRATVDRILSGDYASAAIRSVMAVAEALGMEIQFSPSANAYNYRKQQARKWAERLVGAVQGTMGLEAQGIDRTARDRLVEEETDKLVSGSKRKLWG
jgi:predicted transcriptional regulator